MALRARLLVMSCLVACGGRAAAPDPTVGPDPVPLVATDAAGGGASPAIATDEPPPSLVVAGDGDAAAPRPPAPPPPPAVEPTPPPLPAALAAAPAWTHRRLETGMVPRQHRLTTYRLHRAGAAAALVWEEQTSDAPGEQRELGPWSKPALVEQLVGTATPVPGGVRLTLRAQEARADGGYEQRWLCRTGRTRVAGARAVMVPAVAPGKRPPGDECSGDPGRWVPARTRPIATLTCDPLDQPEDGIRLVFAAGAGIEEVDVNDDCDLQGVGLRQASPAGVVAPVRP